MATAQQFELLIDVDINQPLFRKSIKPYEYEDLNVLLEEGLIEIKYIKTEKGILPAYVTSDLGDKILKKYKLDLKNKK